MVSWSCKAVIEFEITYTCGERLVLHRVFKTTLGREECGIRRLYSNRDSFAIYQEKPLCLQAKTTMKYNGKARTIPSRIGNM